MMVAAGPYTLDDDLLYQPLAALIDVAINERPDVLILARVPLQTQLRSTQEQVELADPVSSSGHSSIRPIR